MNPNNEQIFTQWLNSPACWALLKKCARKCCSPLGKKHAAAIAREQSTPEDIATEIWIMLKTRQGTLKGTLTTFIVRHDWIGLQRYLTAMAVSSIQEQNRDKYYQRVRQALSKTDTSFGYQAGKSQTSYGSLKQEALPIPPYTSLLDEGWAPVFPAVPTDSVKNAAVIIQLATVFRDQLQSRFGPDIRIPIRDLCSYIRAGWPEGTEYDIKEAPVFTGNDNTTPVSQSDALTLADNSGDTNCNHTEEWLKDFTDRVALHLDDQQLLLVICLSVYCQFTQQKVAQIMGLSGPSHVNYKLKKATTTIHLFTSQEEGLGSDDLDENLYDLFLKMLLNNCKDEDCSRSYQEKGAKKNEELS